LTANKQQCDFYPSVAKVWCSWGCHRKDIQQFSKKNQFRDLVQLGL